MPPDKSLFKPELTPLAVYDQQRETGIPQKTSVKAS
jgi:hypothetical protein